MWKTTKICEVTLRKSQIMAPLNHSTDDLGNGLYFVEVLSDFGIGFSDMVFVIIPACHIDLPPFWRSSHHVLPSPFRFHGEGSSASFS
jgi:hypothetical protein